MESHGSDITADISTTLLQEDDFRIKGAAGSKRKRSHAEPENCTICLEAITDRAVAVPCNHLSFDFVCLAQWLQEHTTCPLCKAEVVKVQYDWRDPEDFKTYNVPEKSTKAFAHNAGSTSNRRRSQPRRRRDIGWGPAATNAQPGAEDAALTRRQRVYSERSFSLHVGTNRLSQYQNFTPADFTASADLQSRTRTFLRRELRVFDYLEPGRSTGPCGNRDFLIEYIVAILKTHEPKASDGHPENLIADFLGRQDARLLLHELDAWLRSPYTSLEAWDRHVQYRDSGSRFAKNSSGRS